MFVYIQNTAFCVELEQILVLILLSILPDLSVEFITYLISCHLVSMPIRLRALH